MPKAIRFGTACTGKNMDIGPAIAAVLVALINMIGTVLLAWIRGKYASTEVHNGKTTEKPIVTEIPLPPKP